MIKCKAIRKIKDNNNITIGYALKDESGKVVNFKTDDIKQHIKNGALVVENLRITSDNRLIYSSNKEYKPREKKTKQIKYDKVSHAEIIKTDKNTTVGYTNYSDVYDFHSPMQSFEYNLPKTYYKGYIKDKKDNIYFLIASEECADTGRIAGGTTYYYVTIKYKNKDISLSGYKALFSNPNGDHIIEDIYKGYYLEDYLTKNKSYVDFGNIGIVDEITKDNEYNPISVKEQIAKQKAIEEETRQKNLQNQFKSRYTIMQHDALTVEKDDSRLSPQLKQRENVLNAIYIDILDDYNNKFAIDNETGLICIVNTKNYTDVTSTVHIRALGEDRVLNSKQFDLEKFKKDFSDRRYDRNLLSKYLYRFKGKLCTVQSLIIDTVLNDILCKYGDKVDNKIAMIAESCGYCGLIEYNLRSDVFYFINGRGTYMISISLNHSEESKLAKDCGFASSLNYVASEYAYRKNMFTRVSYKSYKPHKNTVTIWEK